jgi:uncharacterized protein (TIGR03000 family)
MPSRLRRPLVLGLSLLLLLGLADAAAQDKAPPDKAVVKVRLVADAKLTIDGEATTPTGPVRTFVSDAMKPGAKFEYVFKATWDDKGQKRTASKKQTVEPGKVYEVDLTTPDKGPDDADAKKKADAAKLVKEGQDALKDAKKAEDFDKVIKMADDALKLDPDNADAKKLKKDATDAVGIIKKTGAAKLVRDGQEALKDAKKAEDFDKVIKMADDALKLDPDNADAKKLKADAEKAKPKEEEANLSRTFLFTYAATITDLPRDRTARVWVPLAQNNDAQTVEIVSKTIPGKEQIGTDKTYGNKVLYFEGKPDDAGKLSLEIVYKVTRKEVRFQDAAERPESADLLKRLREPDRLGPIAGKPLELLKGKALPPGSLEKGKVLYEVVNNHMKYDKPEGQPWGRGDVVWACDSRYGNCSDFHSLFISLARAEGLPAKFEIGFGLPKAKEGAVGGYHCWAWFKPKGKDWVAVDISEANKEPKMADYYFGNLTADRVAFSVGRDVELVPKQDGEPVNFLIYPYVEVEGKEHDPKKQVRKFSFKDE